MNIFFYVIFFAAIFSVGHMIMSAMSSFQITKSQKACKQLSSKMKGNP